MQTYAALAGLENVFLVRIVSAQVTSVCLMFGSRLVHSLREFSSPGLHAYKRAVVPVSLPFLLSCFC